MKTILIVTILFLSFSYAQNKLQPIGNDIHNFGTITKGSVVKHTFRLKNITKNTLVIDRIESSCGCTAALISKKKLKPNEVAKITAEFNSEGFTGFQEKYVHVYEKNNPVPIQTLKLQATIFVELEIVPLYLVFDNAIVGDKKENSVRVFNRSNTTIKILKVENPFENLQIFIDKYELLPGDYTTIRGIFTPKVSGLIRGSIILHTNAKQKKVEVKFYSNVKDKI